MPSFPNPDLATLGGDKPRWNSPAHRRHGFHNLHRLARYGQSFRAGAVLALDLDASPAIAARADVMHLTGLPWFSAMLILRGTTILYERHAPDFPPHQPHAIMSISKTTLHLIVGRLVEQGRIALSARVAEYLPWIGAGYAGATVQQVLNMDVLNDYSEDYSDPLCKAFAHEAATGLRLPPGPEQSARQFLAGVGLAPGAADCRNTTGLAMYRSANTDVLALVAEAAGGRPMAAHLADIADASGLEGALHVATDRGGFPMMNGGICLSARDLGRYGLLLARAGRGINGETLGSAAFQRATLAGGVPMPAPRGHLRYSNQTNTNGRWLGHGGYGGQYMLVDPQTETVGLFLSVLENADGYDSAYYPPIIAMLADIATATGAQKPRAPAALPLA